MGKVFSKGLEKEDKKERLLKRLKNIEEENEKELKMIENKEIKQLGRTSVINIVGDELSQEAKNIICILSNQENIIDYKRPDFMRDKKFAFDFKDYRSLKELSREFNSRNLQ